MKIAIVGAGKLGMKVTNALVGGDHSITIIDKNEAVINRIAQQYDVMTVVGNAKQVSLLKKIPSTRSIFSSPVRTATKRI